MFFISLIACVAARGGGGESAYESGGDTRRLAKGCKFRILVSFRVFWAKRHHIYLICLFLIRFIYSIYIIQVFSFVCVLTWSLLGVKKSLGHAQIGLL